MGLSTRLLHYAQMNDLPQSVLYELDILQHLRESWTALRTVQTQAQEERSKWLNKLADSVATATHTTRNKALAQIAQESVTKETFRKIRFISKGAQSSGLSEIKRPTHDWYYFPPTDKLFRYSKGAFYAHPRLDSTDNVQICPSVANIHGNHSRLWGRIQPQLQPHPKCTSWTRIYLTTQ